MNDEETRTRLGEIKRKEAAHDAAVARMVAILKEHGISMSVGSCGCCSSPWVTFKYGGETLLDDAENSNFDTEEKQ